MIDDLIRCQRERQGERKRISWFLSYCCHMHPTLHVHHKIFIFAYEIEIGNWPCKNLHFVLKLSSFYFTK